MADFRWYLNRQGVRGAKGDKGEKGFSPSITEKENTKESYILHIQNETDDTSFDTPNLKEGLVPEDLGGTYVRLNRDTGNQYYGDIEEGTNIVKGIVRFATDDEVADGSEVTAAVTPDQVAEVYPKKAVTDKLTTDLTALTTQEQADVTALGKRITANETDISSTKADVKKIAADVDTNKKDIANLKTGKQDKLTAGDGITLASNKVSVNVDGQTIVVQDGKLHANMDELGNEVNDLSGRVTANEADITTLKTEMTDVTGDVEKLQTNVTANNSDILTLKNSVATKQTKLTAGANITLTDLTDGTVKIDAASGTGEIPVASKTVLGGIKVGENLTIAEDGTLSATGGGSGTGDVTAAGNNVFTGTNTFNDVKIVQDYGINFGSTGSGIKNTETQVSHEFSGGNTSNAIIHNTIVTAGGTTGGDIILAPTDYTVTDNLTATDTTVKGKVCDSNGNAYIKQDTIEAGDNVTIEKTETGVKVSSAGSSTPTNMVTTDTQQTITQMKTFSKGLRGTTYFNTSSTYGDCYAIAISDTTNRYNNMELSASGSITLYCGNSKTGRIYLRPWYDTGVYIQNRTDGNSAISYTVIHEGLLYSHITAGDGITIEKVLNSDKKNTGIKISASAPTVTTIDGGDSTTS